MIKIDYNKDNLNNILIRLYLNDKECINKSIEWLFNNGYSKKGILYALSRKDVQEKLEKYQNDSRLSTIFINEVKKYAYKN